MLAGLDALASVFHCMHCFTHTLPMEQGLSCSSFLSYSTEVCNKGHVDVESGRTSAQPLLSLCAHSESATALPTLILLLGPDEFPLPSKLAGN